MNLPELIDAYVAYRRALGEKLMDAARILRAFGRALGADATADDVRPEQVRAFLDGNGPLTGTWYKRHQALLGFYRYATSRGHVHTSPLPDVLPQRPPPFFPYIYTHDELRRLLLAAGSSQRPRDGLESITMRAIVLLLYGTGLRLGEAVALDRTDVDLEGLVLTVRQTKFHKSRLVPVGPHLGQGLAQYVASRPRLPASGELIPFFTRRDGMRVSRLTVERCFVRVRQQAGVERTDGASYQPRLHDLRHSAARRIMPTRSAG